MTKAKGILHGNVIELLEPLDAPEGSEVEVLWEPSEKDRQEARERLLALMEQGLFDEVPEWDRDSLYDR